MKKYLAVALAALLLWSVAGFGQSIERLERLAGTDLFPEVRAAAAIGLAQLWVNAPITNAELEDIAQNGITEELRQAAAQALATRTVTADLSLDELQTLASDSPFAEVRTLATDLLSQALLNAELELGFLQDLASNSESDNIRQAAIPALTQALFESATLTEDLVTLANEGEGVELRQAAAFAVLQRIEETLEPLDSNGLIDLINGGGLDLSRIVGQNNIALQQAAAEAFAPNIESLSVNDIEAIASDESNSPALRQVASDILQQRLLREDRSLDELLALANEGATPEVQLASVIALEEELVFTVGTGGMTLDSLLESINDTNSDAYNMAASNAVFTLLRPNLIFVIDQPLLEAVVRGEASEIGGALVDGQNIFLRDAATGFLSGLFLQFGAVNRFDNPVDDLIAMATDTSLAEGFRVAAGRALVKFFSSQRQRAFDAIDEITGKLDRIVISGRRGQTEEALELLEEARQLIDDNTTLFNVTAESAGELGTAQRLRTIKDQMALFPDAIRAQNSRDLRDINTIVSGQFFQIQVSMSAAPDISTEELEMFAADGATPELRQAAATVLSQRLNESDRALDELLDLAQNGASEEIQGAAISALSGALLNSDLDDETLLTNVIEGSTFALQRASANAWIARQNNDGDALTALANGSGVVLGQFTVQAQSDEFAEAIAVLVQNRWITEEVGSDFLLDQAQNAGSIALQQAAGNLLAASLFDDGLSQDELIDLTVNSESAAVRQAASEALAQVLISQQLPEGALFGLISQFTLATFNPNSNEDLTNAFIIALAERLLNPLQVVPSSSQRPQLGEG